MMGRKKYTNTSTELLIEFVRSYEVLCDVSSPKYWDTMHSKRLWMEIAEKLGEGGTGMLTSFFVFNSLLYFCNSLCETMNECIL